MMYYYVLKLIHFNMSCANKVLTENDVPFSNIEENSPFV